MITEILYKWFGLDPRRCESCEILREQLHKSDSERSELLHRLLDKDKVEPPPLGVEEFKPIQPQFIPWRVRQQMLEQEDRKAAATLRNREKEIADLEKELKVGEPHADATAAS